MVKIFGKKITLRKKKEEPKNLTSQQKKTYEKIVQAATGGQGQSSAFSGGGSSRSSSGGSSGGGGGSSRSSSRSSSGGGSSSGSSSGGFSSAATSPSSTTSSNTGTSTAQQNKLEQLQREAKERQKKLLTQLNIKKGNLLAIQQKSQSVINKSNVDLMKTKKDLENKIKRGILSKAQAQNIYDKAKNNAKSVEKVISLSKKIYDLISGGKLTERDLDKKTEELNKLTEEFNKRYSGKELNPQTYQQALNEKKLLDIAKSKLDSDKKKFESSTKKKVGEVLWGKSTYDYKYTKKDLDRLEKRYRGAINKYNSAKTKTSKLYWKNIAEKRGYALNLAKQGKIRLISGDVPITPIGSPSAFSKATKIKFVGQQSRGSGGEIITDLVFYTDKGKNVGIARGVTVKQGDAGITITGGKYGKVGYSLRTGKFKASKVKSLVGVERSGKLKGNFGLRSEVKLIDTLRKNKKLGKINLIQRNVKRLVQGSTGTSAVVKGNKFYSTAIKFPSGKLTKVKAPGILADDFASISSLLSKDEWTKIIGKTITGRGNKAEFIGFIKGEKSVGSSLSGLSGNQKQEYGQALKKVIGTVSSALAKASKSKGVSALTKSQKLISASKILKDYSKKLPQISSQLKTITKVSGTNLQPKVVVKPTQRSPITINKTKSNLSPKIRKAQNTKTIQKAKQIIKERVNVAQKQVDNLKDSLKKKIAVKQASDTRARLRQAQNSLLKLKQAQEQLIKLKISLRTPLIKISFSPRPAMIKIPKSKPKVLGDTKILSKPTQLYKVFAKKRGKNVLLQKRLTPQDARNYLAYELDNTLLRSAVIKKDVKSKIAKKLSSKYDGAFQKVKKKFRQYKIKSKSKIPIKGFIEKSKYILDKPLERKQLSRLKKTTRKTKRKITPAQRRKLLQNLKKARLVKKRKNNKK